MFLDWSSGYQKDPALFAKRRAYEASRSGEQKAAFGRMLDNTMVSTRQPLPLTAPQHAPLSRQLALYSA